MKREVVNKCQDTLKDYFGVHVPYSVMRNILINNPSFVGDLDKFGMDTCVREWLANIIGNLVCGCDWPIGGDSIAYTLAFVEKFQELAPSHAIKVDKDFSLTRSEPAPFTHSNSCQDSFCRATCTTCKP